MVRPKHINITIFCKITTDGSICMFQPIQITHPDFLRGRTPTLPTQLLLIFPQRFLPIHEMIVDAVLGDMLVISQQLLQIIRLTPSFDRFQNLRIIAYDVGHFCGLIGHNLLQRIIVIFPIAVGIVLKRKDAQTLINFIILRRRSIIGRPILQDFQRVVGTRIALWWIRRTIEWIIIVIIIIIILLLLIFGYVASFASRILHKCTPSFCRDCITIW
mmetsp:Transcript_27853/g.41109  ORF Transcript_27853/g.41109 Transcript_27853/m.41109 type:complete len:216 (-) Transcript_27853:509-1156(-)